MGASLKRAAEAVDRIAEVAHELRAPLGGLEAMADLLARTPLAPDQEKLVAGLRAAAAHLREVAGDILDPPAASRDVPAASESAFALVDLIESIALSAHARAQAKGLTFIARQDPRLPARVVGDSRRLRQMMENLIDNAVKVTASGGVTLAVRSVDRRGPYVALRISVTDTGPGVPPGQRERLFKPYARLANGVPGTGLGLNLVHRFATAMGGEAGCIDAVGGGAEFWFTLRLKTAGPREEAAQSDETQAAPLASPRILVVDDNRSNRIILSTILEHFGCEVREAVSGEEALQSLRNASYDAVLLDQTLPGLSGVETLRAIRELPDSGALTPVIPVTGRVGAEDKAAFAAAGAVGFVEKPVSAQAIRDSLSRVLGQPLRN
jgi:CheY-like chemotaxis protein